MTLQVERRARGVRANLCAMSARTGTDRLMSLGDRDLPAYFASPRQPTGRAVVVLHEALGLTDDIRRVADRFAAEGYLAVAPDLFAGRGPLPICIVRCMRELARGGGAVADDIEAVRDALLARDDVRAVAVAGFCMGGGFAVLAAGSGAFDVAAPFYGDVPRNPAKLPNLCPTVASFGGRDLAFRDGAERLREHLVAAGQAHDVKTYPEAGHSFMAEYPAWLRPARHLPPMYAGAHPASAADAWARMLAFFDEHMAA